MYGSSEPFGTFLAALVMPRQHSWSFAPQARRRQAGLHRARRRRREGARASRRCHSARGRPGRCAHGVPVETEVARTIAEDVNDTVEGSMAARTAAIAGGEGGGHCWGGRAPRRHPPVIVAVGVAKTAFISHDNVGARRPLARWSSTTSSS